MQERFEKLYAEELREPGVFGDDLQCKNLKSYVFTTCDTIKKYQSNFEVQTLTTLNEHQQKHQTFEELILDDLHPRVNILEKSMPTQKESIGKHSKSLEKLVTQ